MSDVSVLIVEDDIELGEMYADILRRAGLVVEVVHDGRFAFARILARKPDAVILDMHLPHVSGLEILDQIQANHELAATKVIVVTADALLANAVESRVELTLLKPVSFEQLESFMARLLQGSDARQLAY